jgi:hypothetical protein
MVETGGTKDEGRRSEGRERRVGKRRAESGGKTGDGWHSEGREMLTK